MQCMALSPKEGVVLMAHKWRTNHDSVAKLDKVAKTLYDFGYSIDHAARFSVQIKANLRNYERQLDAAQERYAKFLASDNLTPRPTQTSGGRYSG